jgi:hypothetical protein
VVVVGSKGKSQVDIFDLVPLGEKGRIEVDLLGGQAFADAEFIIVKGGKFGLVELVVHPEFGFYTVSKGGMSRSGQKSVLGEDHLGILAVVVIVGNTDHIHGQGAV